MKIPTLPEIEALIQKRLEKRKSFVLNHPGFNHSAVLIPICSENGILNFILTKRTDTLKHHKGEISFPGGRQDEMDKDLTATALRETEEEIGVKSEYVEILGRLDDLFTITRYIITPFVGIIHENIEYHSNTTEVAELLHIPLELFLTEDKFCEKNMVRNGTNYPLYYYYWNNYEIWGATAYIINQFIELIFDFQPSKLNFKRTDPRLVEYFLK